MVQESEERSKDYTPVIDVVSGQELGGHEEGEHDSLEEVKL